MTLVDRDRKPYQLTVEERPGYLYVCVEGEHDSYDVSKAYWKEIADIVISRNVDRVLIDENIRESVTMAEVFQLCSELPSFGFGQTRIAFFDRYLDQHEVNAFGELVAVNRALNGKAFNDIDKAEAWLLRSGLRSGIGVLETV